MGRETACVALGGNVGDVLQHFREALAGLAQVAGPVQGVSRAYRTVALVPEGAPPAPDYWNAVCTVETALSPEALLHCMQGLEAAAGRVRKDRWGPRPLDLDLLLYGQQTRSTAELTLPHGALRSRAFVLQPLCDVAPNARVPPDGKVVAALLGALADPAVGILEVRADWVR